jgi:hypothetical protein
MNRPQHAGLFALRDGVGRDETDRDLGASNVLSRAEIPAADVIEKPCVLQRCQRPAHVGAVVVVRAFFPQTADCRGRSCTFGREDLLPVEPQGVAAHDGGGFLEREAREVLAEGLGEDACSSGGPSATWRLRRCGRAIPDLDAVESVDVHLARGRARRVPALPGAIKRLRTSISSKRNSR